MAFVTAAGAKFGASITEWLQDTWSSIKLPFCGLLLLAVCFWYAAAQPLGITLFEGARLIVGDGSPPIENSAFLVENNRFSGIGRKGQLQTPPGAARVDLTGKTVMPAIVNAHNHLG